MLSRVRRPPSVYLQELKQWQQATKTQITEHRKAFWKSQTEVENQWLDNYTRKTEEKLQKQLVKSKQQTIVLCQRTKEKLDQVDRKQKRNKAVLEARRLQEQQMKESRERLITALNIDSQTWITPANLDERLKEGLIVPLSLDFTDYYQDLKHDISVGKMGVTMNGELQFNNRAETVMRNSLLQPLFMDIKSLIKKVTFSECVKLELDFEAAKSVLKLEEHPDLQSSLTSLRSKYVNLASALHSQDSDPQHYLQKTYEQVVYSQELLYKWNEYMRFARMDDRELKAYMLSGAIKEDLSLKKLEDAVKAAQPEAETWEMDMEDPNPEDSDEVPDPNTVNTKSAASEKDRLLQELSDFDVEKSLARPSASAGTSAVAGFNMYTGEDHTPRSSMYSQTTSEDMEAVLRLMFVSIASRFGEPGDVFESFGMLSEPKMMLKPTEKKTGSGSLVMDKVRKALMEIKDDGLNLEQRVKKSEILLGLEALENVQVTEPRLLYRVFQHHRYPAARFHLD